MRRFVLCAALALSLALPAWSQTLVVATASNLAAVEAPLKAAFSRKYPGMALQFTFGASGTLVAQILNGAPYQAFLSADRNFALRVVDAGLATGPVVTYAVGRLIFLATRRVDLTRGLSVVLDPSVVQFAVAHSEASPYGRAAVEALTRAGVYEQAKSKIVVGQNITQALQFTLLATSFGLVNKSALFSRDLTPYREEGRFWFEVDPTLYTPIEQGFVMLKTAGNRPEGKAFEAFLLSPEARKVFEDFGYGTEMRGK